MRIAISGAGIGGLALAAALQRHGTNVTVFEASPAVRGGGAGITLSANALRALESLGFSDEVASLRHRQPEISGGIRTPDGRWLAVISPQIASETVALGRPELHRLLAAHLTEGTVRTGHDVLACSPDGTLTLRTPDGLTRTERYDVVVGADGIRSAVRHGWPGDPGIRYAGYCAWRGVTDGPVDLGGVGSETWGERTRFGYAPLMDGRVYWFAVRSSHMPGPDDGDPGQLSTIFRSWHEPVPQLIAATSRGSIQYLPIEELAGPLPCYVHGRAVLMGDAAHAMTPNLGQGAAQSLEDAATLASLLAPPVDAHAPGRATVLNALESYDRLRRPRSQWVAARSRLAGRAAHGPGHLLAALRDAAVRAMPQGVFLRGLQQVTSWTCPADGAVHPR